MPPYAARQRPARACDHPGCAAEGEYRAPRSRERLTEYYWFCLDHVRAYNKAWDYCAGMGPDDVEHQVRRDTVWRRPAWPFGGRAPEKDPIPWRIGLDEVEDALGILGLRRRRAPTSPGPARDGRVWPPGSAEAKALRALDLAGPVTLAVVKARYKELAKRFHPDANGGCKRSEERLKSINAAYMTLRKSFTA